MNKIAPRAKCDQVVYEAIAKITEIIVRSRCEEEDLHSSDKNCSDRSRSSSVGGYSTTNNSTVSNSSARFNLEIEEVESIRSILQMWKRSLHVPIRLDIYYEFSPDGDTSTRKELLERWCIDYVASYNEHAFTTNQSGNTAVTDDIAQLRQDLGALKRRQYEVAANRHGKYGDNETGYYSQQTHRRPETQEIISSLCGKILFTFHAYEEDTGASEATFLSLNAPFLRRDLNSIPTPYGHLNLSVLYDNSLNIGRVFKAAAERISRRRSSAIPIGRPMNDSTNYQEAYGLSLPVASADYDVAHRHIIHDYATSPSLRARSFSPHMQRTKAIINKSKSTLTDYEVLNQVATENRNTCDRVLSGISLALMNDEEHSADNTGTYEEYSPRKHADSSDEFILSKQRRAFHQPPPNMASSSLLQQTSCSHLDHNFRSQYSQAYGYSHGRLVNSKTAPICIASTEKTATVTAPVNTPPVPVFLGSTPRLTGSLPYPTALMDETSTLLPPFRNPVELVESKTKESGYSGPSPNQVSLGHGSQEVNPVLPPLSSLDVLALNPFTANSERSTMSSCLYFSAVTRQSQLTLPNPEDDSFSEMPFAIQSNEKSIQTSSIVPQPQYHSPAGGNNRSILSPLPNNQSPVASSSNLAGSEALKMLASRCLTGSRLRTFDDTDGICDRLMITDISTLRNELEHFRSFGDSLAST